MSGAIIAESLVKSYGKTRALDGLDLEVPEGTVLGLLGPNGAGKTTTVKILTTLLRPDSGRALVGGHDVVRDPDTVRRLMGLSGQYAAVDEALTGRENLDMVGRLYHLGGRAARARAAELLAQFGLEEAADRPARTYSGGMRRRLDLAAALVVRPRILFLDEPTTGLDPRSRLLMWDTIASLVRDGATLLLTTQYLEEADQLANSIAVVDHGRVIAQGTADELKSRIGGERVEVVVDRVDLATAAETLSALAGSPAQVDEVEARITIAATGADRLVEAVRALDDKGVRIEDIALRRPTLDDVFLTLTGHRAEEEQNETDSERKAR